MKTINLVVWAACLAMTTAHCASCVDKTVHPMAVQHHDTGISYLNQGRCVQAEESCRLALEYGPNFEHPHNCLGMIELSCHNDLKEAAKHFKNALAVNPDFAEAHNNLGTVFFRETPPDYDLACEEYKAGIEIDPGFQDGRENLGTCMMRRGTIAGDKGKQDERDKYFGEARSHFIRLLQINPNNYNGWHHLGLMDLITKKYESAEQNFKRCLEIDPGNPVCSYNLGNTYLETARCSDAIQAFIGTLRVGNESEVSVGARMNLGTAYEMCAKNDGAIKEFLDRIKLDPGNPTHHFDLGNIYSEKGLEDQAVNEWGNTVKLDPRYCPAYFQLAMHANKMLETDGTIRNCQDFVSCATEVNRDEASPKWSDRIETCKGLVKKLEME